MPKLIDHDARAIALTEAAWRVLAREGVGAISVRNVAAEAGVATASLRRAFPRQSDLLCACLDLMSDRVAARIHALPPQEPTAWALAALCETLPLDQNRWVEMEVYLALGTLAFSDAAVKPAFNRVQGGLTELAEAVVMGLAPGLPPERRRTETLHVDALADGLALGILHGQDPALAVGVLRDHLVELATLRTRAKLEEQR